MQENPMLDHPNSCRELGHSFQEYFAVTQVIGRRFPRIKCSHSQFSSKEYEVGINTSASI